MKTNKKVILGLCSILSLSLFIACDPPENNTTVSDVEYTSEVTDDYGISKATNEYMESGEEITSETPIASQKLIKNVYLNIETKDIETSKSSIEKLMKETGSYIESSTYYDNSEIYSGTSYNLDFDFKTYNFTIRVPSDKLDTFIDSVAEYGTIQSKTENTEDVTLQYTDMEARKKTLETSRDRVLALLEEATDLEMILQLEDKLGEITYELESYTSQLKVMDNLVDYSSVELELREVEHIQESGTSFGERVSSGWNDTWYNLKTGFVNFIIFCIVNLPYIIIAGVVIGISLFVVRFSNKKIKKLEKEKKPKE